MDLLKSPETWTAVITLLLPIIASILRERGKEKAAVWIDRLAPVVVGALEQTRKGGQFAPSGAFLKAEAAHKIKAQLPPTAKLAGKKIDAMIDDGIENAVHNLKLAKAAAGAGK